MSSQVRLGQSDTVRPFLTSGLTTVIGTAQTGPRLSFRSSNTRTNATWTPGGSLRGSTWMETVLPPAGQWEVRSDQVMSCHVMSNQIRAGQGRAGQGRAGQGRAGQVMSGQVRSDQIRSDQGRSVGNEIRDEVSCEVSWKVSGQVIGCRLLIGGEVGVDEVYTVDECALFSLSSIRSDLFRLNQEIRSGQIRPAD